MQEVYELITLDGFVLVLGLAIIIAAACIVKHKNSRKPRDARMSEYFKRYDERMDEFRNK